MMDHNITGKTIQAVYNCGGHFAMAFDDGTWASWVVIYELIERDDRPPSFVLREIGRGAEADEEEQRARANELRLKRHKLEQLKRELGEA